MTPEEIERKSFEIITAELEKRGRRLPPETAPVIKRVIHTTADFDFAETLVFSPGVIATAQEALRTNTPVITDTNMAKAGITAAAETYCFVADEDVAQAARSANTTRSRAAVDKAARLHPNAIYAVGNAPTALIRICELIQEGTIRPALVIGAPVGFVNVIESKTLLAAAADTPHIIAAGQKGGSPVAAAICNALIKLAAQRSAVTPS